jgi:hypothetical protein
MTRSFHIAGLCAAAALAGVAPSAAQAATFLFTGVRANVNLINPPGTGRCAPLNTVNIAPGALSSTGFSNFGAFASTQSHCIPGAPNAGNPVQPITDGQFSYDFGAGDLLTGTYSGQASFSNGVVTGTENLVVTGGTGFVGVFNGTVNGRINVPGAVPEPATWAMMIAGFGLAGSAARRRRLQAAYA